MNDWFLGPPQVQAEAYLLDQMPIRTSDDAWEDTLRDHARQLVEMGLTRTNEGTEPLFRFLCSGVHEAPSFAEVVNAVHTIFPNPPEVIKWRKEWDSSDSGSSKFSLKLFGDVKVQRNVSALIKGLIGLRGLVILYGESGIGKSFWTFYLAISVALGREFYGHKVQKGGVIYVCLENGQGFENRIAAEREARSLAGESVPFGLVTCPINLMDRKGDTKLLIDEIENASQALGAPVALLVIDTLARAMSGGDENSVQDMSTFVNHLDLIRESAKCAIIVVHHSGKDQAKGARGSSALRAAADTEMSAADFELKVGRESRKVPGVKVVKVTKQRDFEGGQEFGFTLKSVDLGKDDDGELIRSCVVEPKDLRVLRDFGGLEPMPDSNEGRALATLKALLDSEGEPTPAPLRLLAGETVVRRDVWRDRFCADHCKDVPPEKRSTRSSRFNRAAETLYASHGVTEKDGYVWI